MRLMMVIVEDNGCWKLQQLEERHTNLEEGIFILS